MVLNDNARCFKNDSNECISSSRGGGDADDDAEAF